MLPREVGPRSELKSSWTTGGQAAGRELVSWLKFRRELVGDGVALLTKRIQRELLAYSQLLWRAMTVRVVTMDTTEAMRRFVDGPSPSSCQLNQTPDRAGVRGQTRGRPGVEQEPALDESHPISKK